ncbi:MAG: response regulator [Gemmatimonadaceae bacterium]|nr:response regulator [Gloeobacterales cyanobacterium ES-bin-141]
MASEKVNVLLVDDRPENLLALEATLDRLGQNLVKAHSGAEALRCLLHQDFAVILLDVQMPEIDGFETAALIRQRERSRHTPIIFLTAFSASDKLIFKGYSLGAVDYLAKPLDPEILFSKVTVFVELFKKNAEVKSQRAELASVNSELQQSEQRLQDFLDNASDLIQIVSPEGRFLFVNCTWREVLGYRSEALENLNCFDIIHPDCCSNFTEAMRLAQKDRRNHWLEMTFLNRSGDSVAVEGSLNCQFENGRPKAIRCIFHDTTERKQAEAARVQMFQEQVARQQAETANRMKDEFLAMVSHELRTPLNSMLGWSQLLKSRKLDEHTQTRALDAIERNARAQAQLIEDLLDISRIVSGKLHLKVEPVDLATVVEAALDAVRPLVEAKSLALEVKLEQITGSIQGDANRLQQVVWNLLTNAIKFTHKGGQIWVQLVQHPSQVELVISDSGQGIRAEFLPHIFKRFQQADSTSTRAHGGLGLGLSIVHHLVKLHGGGVEASSAGEGKGATFRIQLPIKAVYLVADNDLRPLESRAPLTLETDARLVGLRILVVDDEPDAREFVTTVLSHCGAEVTATGSVAEAMAAIEAADILVSDIGMPGEDGYALIRKVRALGKAIPAIALTAYARTEDRTQALLAGFQMHVPKPVEPAELIAAVASLAEQRIRV